MRQPSGYGDSPRRVIRLKARSARLTAAGQRCGRCRGRAVRAYRVAVSASFARPRDDLIREMKFLERYVRGMPEAETLLSELRRALPTVHRPRRERQSGFGAAQKHEIFKDL